MSKNIDENISKNLSGKHSQRILVHAKQSATAALKTTSKRVIGKKAEATGYLIVIKLLIKLWKSPELHH